jgi:3-oxoacyl-[acyl-carrier-protein] synthase-3
MDAIIKAIEYHLPERVETNAELQAANPDWDVDKIAAKTGITARRIAAEGECASDLAVAAAEKLFAGGACRPEEIDWVLFCTQSPDYVLPTTACLIQHRLGIPTRAGAMDFNLGCSGYVYGLGVAKGLIETRQATRVLLLTAETYSKFIHPADRTVRTIFGDAGAATLVQGDPEADPAKRPFIGPFIYGTDGSGGNNLIVRSGGVRQPKSSADTANNAWPPLCNLYMNGPEIFVFTLETVPACVNQLLAASGKSLDDIDLFVFHQANQYMLEHLRRKLKIPEDRFFVDMHEIGNTVSATIPIALNQAQLAGRLHSGQLVMLVGFGVGYSWAATLVRWP